MVLVIGGTRGTGSLIVHLLEQQQVPVRILARDRMKALKRFSSSVEIVAGNVTQARTLHPAIEGVSHIVFTAGCRSGHPAGEAQVRATEYGGVLNTLAAAREVGFAGRFLYMTASGIDTRSLFSICLNLYKGNTLVWRRRAEEHIRASGFRYTIIRTGVLLNRAAGTHGIRLTQEALPLSVFYRIARADVAEAFVAALDCPQTVRTTFEIIWDRRARAPWPALMHGLQQDNEISCCRPS